MHGTRAATRDANDGATDLVRSRVVVHVVREDEVAHVDSPYNGRRAWPRGNAYAEGSKENRSAHMTSGYVVDDTLNNWSSIAGESWDGLLLGNGGSMAIWSKFGYRSLYEEACNAGFLTNDSIALFSGMDTSNFEEVLSRLQTAISVERLLGHNTSREESIYTEVRVALIKAVQQVHIQHGQLPGPSRDHLKDAIKQYTCIYTTNYDLLVYWAIQREQDAFDDLFRLRDDALVFVSEAEQTDRKRVFYLHGALHLFRTQAGITRKDANDGTEDLLTRFETKRDWINTTPLFVTEGTAADKLRVIRGSEYLSYVYKRFSTHSGSLVIFGLALGESDAHLSSQIRNWPKRRLAISVRPSDPDIKDTKTRVRHALGWRHDLVFFDSTTHPLGMTSLRVG